MADNTNNKWMMLADRIVKRTGIKREYGYEDLRREFIAFVDYYTSHPASFIQRTKQKQKGADKRKADYEFSGDRVDKTAPMTELAFCTWLGKCRSWFPQTIADLEKREHRTEEDNLILDFMKQLRAFFSAQLLEGAVLGDYSQPLVASLLGMRNQVDVTSGGKSAVPVISIVEDKKSRAEYDAGNAVQEADGDKVE